MNFYHLLLSYIQSLQSTIVAFSGGVDSALLLKIAKDAEIRVCAVTVQSEFTDNEEIEFAKVMAGSMGIKHIIKSINLLSSPEIRSNNKERCYHCKRLIFENLRTIAKEMGYDTIIEGTNADDIKEWRPGIKALKELNINSPFLEIGITKDDIRDLSKRLALPTWNKPSSPCLATRIYYGLEIKKDIVERVMLSEHWLKKRGFHDVRVRTDGLEATIEVEKTEISRLTDSSILPELLNEFKTNGFVKIKLDLQGYERGKLDKV